MAARPAGIRRAPGRRIPPTAAQRLRVPWHPTYLATSAGRHRRALPVEHHRQRHGQPVLRRCGAGRARANWEALLFGSLDAQNFITVDKPPLSQWVMGLSGQLFGFSSASMLIPQALMAVARGGPDVRRGRPHRRSVDRAARGRGAGGDAGGGADVPVQQPRRGDGVADDRRGVLHGRARCERKRGALDGAGGVAVGLAFLAKMLEGVMVMPALAAAYLVAAPVPMRRRWLHLLGGAAAFVAVGGLVRGADAAVAGFVRPVPRRVGGQQLHEPGAGLQRLRPGDGPQPPRLHPPPSDVGTMAGSQLHAGRGGGFGGFGMPDPGLDAVGVGRVRLRDRLAAAHRAGGHRAGGGGAGTRAPHRSRCARAPSCSAGGSRSTRLVLTLDARHDPPVLQPVHRAARRGDVRPRRRSAVGAPRIRLVPRRTRGARCWPPGCSAGGSFAATRTGCPGCGGRSWRWRWRRRWRWRADGRSGPGPRSRRWRWRWR